MNIGGVSIGNGQPCRFVAEISNNHNGDLDRAVRLIDAAKAAGADLVKFQCFTPDELVALRGDGPAPEPWGAQGWTMRTLYEKAQTPLAWFPQLFQHARGVGIVPFSSVFGATSLACLEAVDCPAYKIAALDNDHHWLLEACLATSRPVIVSTRAYRVDLASAEQLLCPVGYPTPAADVHLPRDFFAAGFWGLSSHCLDKNLPVAAAARGCKLIEMHMMLEAEPSELEANVSLTEHQFAAMIQSVRNTEAMFA